MSGKTQEIGKLRHRLVWSAQQPGPQTATGQQPTVYAEQGTFWAAIEPLKGFELFQAAQMKSTSDYRIVMRSLPIQVGDQLIFRSTVHPQTFIVDTVVRQDNLNEFISLTATEQVLIMPPPAA